MRLRSCSVLFFGAWLTLTAWPAAHAESGVASAGVPAAISPGVLETVWQGNPLAVPLKVNSERRIDFPEPITDMDVPQAVEKDSRIVLTPTGQLHWTARAPFAAVRVLATSVSGTLYQLDVSARTEGEAPDPLILRDPVLQAAAHSQTLTPSDRARGDQAARALVPDFLKDPAGRGRSGGSRYATLTRFALAHYTGPQRLIPELEASRVPVQPIETRAWLRVQAADLEVRPLAQWKSGELYVTALGVYNRSAHRVTFDPRALRGELAFVAALHPILAPAGSGHQGTVWAVVTQQPFNRVVDRHAVSSNRSD